MQADTTPATIDEAFEQWMQRTYPGVVPNCPAAQRLREQFDKAFRAGFRYGREMTRRSLATPNPN
ncbi:MAG: hypothetical protein WC107_06120 [Patescibacteria group bacterium]